MKQNINQKNSPIIPLLLTVCFIVFTVLSWIIVFRDPRALIGISNLYPFLKEFLFSTQETLSHYGLNSIPTIAFAGTAIVACIVYVISLVKNISLKKTLVFAVLFQIITFVSFPVLSTDIFSYMFSERVSTTHHENIWKVKPETFYLQDQFGVLADWRDTTSVYGGVHYALYYLPSVIGNDDLLTLVLLYKSIALAFSFTTLYLLYKVLLFEKVPSVEKGLRLVFWNPLFVLEIIGSGHNDIAMIFFMILGYYFFRKKLWLFSGIILALAMQVKLIPIVLFFFFFLSLIRNKAIVSSLLFLTGFLAVNALCFSFMQVHPMDFVQRVAYNGGVYWQSLPTIGLTYFPEWVSYISYIFFLWVVVMVGFIWKKKIDPVTAYCMIILGYLLFASAAYWNWYILWILPLLPLLPNRKLFFTTLVLSFTSLLAYALLWVMHRINNHASYWPFVTYLFIFGPPIIAYIILQLFPAKIQTIVKKYQFDQLIAEKGLH